ncbi:unnamed protein product [Lasius platythorax]|uniref:E3 SUMO-protein ligase NSE2 n=2 Tax=Lasius TaxID=488720 RepID=A0A0J7L6Y8_LASNI|nr:e3 sumo-protein ligase nse2-like protein [Lasius niger]
MAQASQMIETLDDCFVKTANNIMKHYVEEERKKILGELRDVLKESCNQSARMIAANEIREQQELAFDPETKNVEDILTEYKEAISNIQVDSSEYSRLLEYDRQIKELVEANKDASNNELDVIDSDLRVTSQERNVIDPITKTRMVDPVRNAVCGHVYDKGSLIAMLQKNKNTRCPAVGCTSTDYIDLNQCRTDIVIKMYLEKNPA